MAGFHMRTQHLKWIDRLYLGEHISRVPKSADQSSTPELQCGVQLYETILDEVMLV